MGAQPLSRRNSIGAEFFDALYAENPDPWDFETSPYEDAKYAETLNALAGRRYRRTLEVGCSIGVLTRRLAAVTDALVAIDPAERPLAMAAVRNSDKPDVVFLKGSLPDALPDGPFDLIVLSEVLYYLDADDLERATDEVLDRLEPGGDVILVHWLGETDYPLTGDEAVAGFIQRAGSRLTKVRQTRQTEYRLDLFRKSA